MASSSSPNISQHLQPVNTEAALTPLLEHHFTSDKMGEDVGEVFAGVFVITVMSCIGLFFLCLVIGGLVSGCVFLVRTCILRRRNRAILAAHDQGVVLENMNTHHQK